MIMTAALTLAGCASGPERFPLGTGIASYDALRSANADCNIRGGQVELRRGGDGAQLADYACVIPGAK
jgi:hypothetical protein